MSLIKFLKKNIYNKKGRRVGRGCGSGCGKTSGRGHKGQKSRAGSSVRESFEGGQMPLYRTLPKFGFKGRLKQDKTIKFNFLSKKYINNSNLNCYF